MEDNEAGLVWCGAGTCLRGLGYKNSLKVTLHLFLSLTLRFNNSHCVTVREKALCSRDPSSTCKEEEEESSQGVCAFQASRNIMIYLTNTYEAPALPKKRERKKGAKRGGKKTGS